VTTAAALLAVATSGLLSAFTISPPKVVLPGRATSKVSLQCHIPLFCQFYM